MYLGGRNRFECGGHFEKVMGVCLVEQKSLLVSGGCDRLVRLWDPRAPPRSRCVDALSGHLGAITAVAADPDGTRVYTTSEDRSVRIWDLRTKRFTNTLLGHVDHANALDIYQSGKPLTGGADKTLRMWKVEKDTHLMFSKHTYSVDAVAVADNERVISGSQDGSLMLWTVTSKRPIVSASCGKGRWVSALGAMRSGNVFFSGTVDGALTAWRFSRPTTSSAEGSKPDKGLQLAPVTESSAAPKQAPGCVNAVAVGKSFVACAIGKEHRLGRWFYDKKQKNGLMLVPLSYREA